MYAILAILSATGLRAEGRDLLLELSDPHWEEKKKQETAEILPKVCPFTQILSIKQKSMCKHKSKTNKTCLLTR